LYVGIITVRFIVPIQLFFVHPSFGSVAIYSLVTLSIDGLLQKKLQRFSE